MDQLTFTAAELKVLIAMDIHLYQVFPVLQILKKIIYIKQLNRIKIS